MKAIAAAIGWMKSTECEGVDPYAMAVDVAWLTGCAVAGAISASLKHSLGWVLFHVLASWVYVAYVALKWMLASGA